VSAVKILIVEDEIHLNDLLHDYIKDAFIDAEIKQLTDGYDALIAVQEHTYDIVLLDVMLPHVDGFEICKKLRETSQAPVMMLSALNDEDNQIKGYNLGIDEYIPKPYSPKLVVKKMEAILSRSIPKDTEALVEYGIITYNLSNHKILIEGQPIELNKKEWDLFTLFIHNPGHLFSRDDLLNKIWGFDYFGDIRTVDTHIKRLRQKLLTASTYIKTVFKSGYTFEK